MYNGTFVIGIRPPGAYAEIIFAALTPFSNSPYHDGKSPTTLRLAEQTRQNGRQGSGLRS